MVSFVAFLTGREEVRAKDKGGQYAISFHNLPILGGNIAYLTITYLFQVESKEFRRTPGLSDYSEPTLEERRLQEMVSPRESTRQREREMVLPRESTRQTEREMVLPRESTRQTVREMVLPRESTRQTEREMVLPRESRRQTEREMVSPRESRRHTETVKPRNRVVSRKIQLDLNSKLQIYSALL